jgi:glutamyl-tRNA reductase
MIKNFKIVALTHKVADLKEIGKLHLDAENQQTKLGALKSHMGLQELMFLSTCNRVEFLFVTGEEIDSSFLHKFLTNFNPLLTEAEIAAYSEKFLFFEGEEALKHLFRVASSIDSLVVGEREIITQVRNSYEACHEIGITGDTIRLAIKKTIEVAKNVFTRTKIAGRPVSVVSLAYRRLRELHVSDNARFLIIGAGQTNISMARYLKKHKYSRFTIFNRSLANAQKLAEELKGTANLLDELGQYSEGFDVILTCTGASEPIITQEIYNNLLQGDTSKKIIIDLAIPYDLDVLVKEQHPIHYIEIESLKAVAAENLKARSEEMHASEELIEEGITEFKKLYQIRAVEQAMKEVPQKVREIKETAISTVFAKDLQHLDGASREVLDKILDYMEKKYISVPMKMAREIMVEKSV